MLWTFSSNGVEKTCADWGASNLRRTLKSQAVDELTFIVDGAAADAPPIFTEFGPTVTLWRDRQIDSNGNFTGGEPWFSGIVTQVPRAGSPDAESMQYKLAGPWWYLDNLVFFQPWQNILLSIGVGPVLGPGNSSHLFLNLDTGASKLGSTITKITTGAQIIQALQWCLNQFTSNPPFQIGRVTPDIIPPVDEVHDITCAEVIRKMLRWTPDAVTWFDYTTTPPTFNCIRRADMETLGIPYANLLSKINITARNDLKRPFVEIFYEYQNSFQGTNYLSLGEDHYPDPLPTDILSKFRGVQFTVNLQGTAISQLKANVVCDPISLTDPEWWLRKHPQYRPLDPSNPADAQNKIASFSIDADSIQRIPTDSTRADQGFTNEPRSKSIPTFVGAGTQHLTVSVNANIVYRNGQKPLATTMTFQVMSTNAQTGNYTSQKITQASEPQPVGLARAMFDALNPLQFEGDVTLQEEEVSGQLMIGNLFNITGTNSTEWGAMSAQVVEVEEHLDSGQTGIRFGPPEWLNPQQLTDLLRVNRDRFIGVPFSSPIGGSPGGGGDLDITGDTPEKNSSHDTGPLSAHVVSSNVIGSGPVCQTMAFPGDVLTNWLSNTPGTGSVQISLGATKGQHLVIQPLDVCQNGVEGKIYFLCSAFIANT